MERLSEIVEDLICSKGLLWWVWVVALCGDNSLGPILDQQPHH